MMRDWADSLAEDPPFDLVGLRYLIPRMSRARAMEDAGANGGRMEAAA